MELTQEEQQRLEAGQEILELRKVPAWELWQKTVIETAIADDKRRLTEERQKSWDHYLALWHHKEALESVHTSLDRLDAGVKALQAKAAQEPDNSPATGELA